MDEREQPRSRSGERDDAPPEPAYECVEPELGDQLWRLEVDVTDAALCTALLEHLSVCDACRIERGAERAVARLLQAGAPPSRLWKDSTPRPKPRSVIARWTRMRPPLLGATAATALAASLAAILFGPVHGGGDRDTRGGEVERFRFRAPIEGQVLATRRPTLVWSPLAQATGYRVSIQQVDGSFRWETTTRSTLLRPPPASALPAAATLRAIVRPVPEDLAPPEGIGVRFRTGGPLDAARFRLGAAPAWLRGLLGLSAAACLLAAGVAQLRKPRRQPRAPD